MTGNGTLRVPPPGWKWVGELVCPDCVATPIHSDILKVGMLETGDLIIALAQRKKPHILGWNDPDRYQWPLLMICWNRHADRKRKAFLMTRHQFVGVLRHLPVKGRVVVNYRWELPEVETERILQAIADSHRYRVDSTPTTS